ncbi:N-acetylmuramoyl-L-alanine amidase [Candidatus Leptofilum sp.]|uniref:N-acetylmuramoyl-L-alanine amidase n=1 Tax=Candidatus Leptofilum sp. TaxID=3241576 RepID=UPI003B594B0D
MKTLLHTRAIYLLNIVVVLSLLTGPFLTPMVTAVSANTTSPLSEQEWPVPSPVQPFSAFANADLQALAGQQMMDTVVSPPPPDAANFISPRQQNRLNADPLDNFAQSGFVGDLQNGVFIPQNPLDFLSAAAQSNDAQPYNAVTFANVPAPARIYVPTQSMEAFTDSALKLAQEPTQIFLPSIATSGSTPVITPDAGGQVTGPGNGSMTVRFNFATGAVERPATGQYLTARPLNTPPSLTVVGSGFALSVKDVTTQDAVSYFPPQVVTETAVLDPEFNRTIYTYTIIPTAKVTVQYHDADVLGLQEDRLRIYQQNPLTGVWEGLGSTVDPDANMVTADIAQDGRFVLLAPHTLEPNLTQSITLASTQFAAAATPLVILDPDHGGGDLSGGHVSYPLPFAAFEEEYNLQVANLVRDRLTACGVDVIMTRDGDYYVTLPARTNQINSTNPDAAITLAFDIVNPYMSHTYENLTGTGVAAWVDYSEPLQTAFGEIGMSRVNEYTGLRNRDLKNGDYMDVVIGVDSNINYTHLELAFMDNYFDRAIMDDPVGMGKIADGVFAAITDILGGASTCTNPDFEFPEPLIAAERERLWQLGYQNWMRYRWDPVNTTTGNLIQRFTDLAVPGINGFDLVIERFYNGFDDRPGAFGHNWSSFLDMSLRLANDGSVDVRLADGSGVYFEGDGTTFTPGQDGVFMDLLRNGPDFMLTTPEQVTYHFIQNGYMAYLVAVNDRWGNSITIERDSNGNPTQITDSAGRIYDIELTSINNNADFISRITDPSGRTVQYAYDNGTQDLLTVTDPNGGDYQFTYDGDHNLHTITDPADILYLQNSYDGQGRVIEQLDASGSQGSGSYDASSTTVTDNLSNNTIDEYDALGRVTATTDALGNTEYFAYDDDYNVVSYTDKRGNTWTYSYDAQGNLLTKTDPLGHVTSYTYNSDNDLTSVTDEGGPGGSARTTSYVYDADGNLVRIENADGSVITAHYDAAGQMIFLQDANGNLTFYQYDDDGNLVRITDALGNVTVYGYDAVGRQTSITDANGNTAHFIYDNNDNIVEIVDPKGASTYFTYDVNDNLIQMVDRRGGVTTYAYDENLKLISETDPEGHTTTYSYDAMYNRVSMTDPSGNQTLYRYDVLYQLIEVENALGAVTAFTYDENGNITVVVDALLNATTFDYDVLNRLETQTDALGYTTRYTYDAVGRQSSMTNPIGAVTQYEYDLMDRMVEMTDGLGGVWTMAYDANGNLTAQTDANGHTTQMAYDAVDRLIALMDAGGHTTTFAYDGVGNLLTETDALGRVTTYTYDENDNAATITDALGGVTTFAYDAEDNLISVTDANGHTTQFEYDLDGLMTLLIEAGGQETTYEYDAAHNLNVLTNAKGNAWTYGYDALNRRISEVDPLGHATLYDYDLSNRLTTLTDALGVVTAYQYDALDRLTAVIQNHIPAQPTDHETNVYTHYTYDGMGNLLTITDGNSETTTFAYDLLSRLTQETNPIGNVWQYQYDAVGNLIRRVDAKGDTTDYTYDADDLLVEAAYPDGSSISYAYDPVHNQTAMTDALGLTVNEYDALNRLIATTNHVGQTVRYTYDAVGNRLSMVYPDGRTVTYAYDATNYQNGVTDPDGNHFAVVRDATHNITTINYPNETTAVYTFDAADRLTSVYNHETNGNLISTFDYTLDAVGNRTRTEGAYEWRQPTNLDYDYQYDPLYRLIRSDDSDGHFTAYDYDAVGNRLHKLTNDDPTLTRTVDELATTYTYNGANQLLTAVDDLTPRANPDRLRQVGQMVRAFVHEVEAQEGHHITPSTAATLLDWANTLLDDLEGAPPPDATEVAAALTNLENEVISAGNNGWIDNAGIVNSLLAKLSRAHQANQETGGELMTTFFTYDANGNRIERLAPVADTANDNDWLRTDYVYDYENRMEQVQDFHDPNGNGNWLALDETVLTFDGYGRVFRRLHDQHIGGGGQSWVDYVYDGLDPIAEYLEPSPQYTNYYRGLGRILSQNDGQGGGQGSLYYYHYDGLGSVSAMTKHQGQGGHTYRYNDFGIILDNNGHAADASNFTDPHNHYTYTGQEWDEYTELFHFYAREYDPQTGTWLQQDPYRGRLQFTTTLHRYGYVENDPVNNVDAYGFSRVSVGLTEILQTLIENNLLEEFLLDNQLEISHYSYDSSWSVSDSLRDQFDRLGLSLDLIGDGYIPLARHLILEMARNRISLTSLKPYLVGRTRLLKIGDFLDGAGEVLNLVELAFNGLDSIERARQGEIDSPEVYFGEVFALSANTINGIITGPGRTLAKVIFGQEAVDRTPVVAQLDQSISGRQVVDNIETLFEVGPKRYFGCAWNALQGKTCQ